MRGRVLLCAALTASLAACAADDPGMGSVPDAVASVSIMKDSGVGHFHMPVVEVAVGGSVEWTNRSGVIHNVVFNDASLTSSPLFEDNETFTASFPKAGRFSYVCTIHPAMTGTVVVR